MLLESTASLPGGRVFSVGDIWVAFFVFFVLPITYCPFSVSVSTRCKIFRVCAFTFKRVYVLCCEVKVGP